MGLLSVPLCLCSSSSLSCGASECSSVFIPSLSLFLLLSVFIPLPLCLVGLLSVPLCLYSFSLSLFPPPLCLYSSSSPPAATFLLVVVKLLQNRKNSDFVRTCEVSSCSPPPPTPPPQTSSGSCEVSSCSPPPPPPPQTSSGSCEVSSGSSLSLLLRLLFFLSLLGSQLSVSDASKCGDCRFSAKHFPSETRL